jgi:hypothetical protein
MRKPAFSLFFLFLFFLRPSLGWACTSYLETPTLTERLSHTGLTAEQIKTLRSHAAGMSTLEAWLSRGPHEGVLLGIMGENESYTALQQKSKMMSWETAYQKFGIGFGESAHTQKFLESLSRSEWKVVFLLPPSLWSHPQGVITKRELWWYLQHPDQMKNVFFVLEPER